MIWTQLLRLENVSHDPRPSEDLSEEVLYAEGALVNPLASPGSSRSSHVLLWLIRPFDEMLSAADDVRERVDDTRVNESVDWVRNKVDDIRDKADKTLDDMAFSFRRIRSS